jgi:hypothetical protein
MHARSIFSRLLGRSASIWLSVEDAHRLTLNVKPLIHHQLWQQ